MARPRFQFHLSTAVVMMLVAGGILGLSLPVKYVDLTPEIAPDLFTSSSGIVSAIRGRYYGFPCVAAFSVACMRTGNSGEFVYFDPMPIRVLVPGFAAGMLFALGTLLLVAAGCEWRIRRSAQHTEGDRSGSR